MSQKPALILFVKNPVFGKVKTRIARTAGPDRALTIYLALLRHTRTVSLQVDADRYVFYQDRIEKNDDWQEDLFFKRAQRGRDIGERMYHTFEDLGPSYDRMILVGGDIPQLSAGIISDGFNKLNSSDFVLGPAADGGYYLIGMRKPEPAVFEGITWSTADVAKLTLQKMKETGGSVSLLPTLSDVDHEEDWETHGWAL